MVTGKQNTFKKHSSLIVRRRTKRGTIVNIKEGVALGKEMTKGK